MVRRRVPSDIALKRWTMKQAPAAHSLAPIFELLDAVQLPSAEREAAKDYLRKSDAVIDFAIDVWKRLRGMTGRTPPTGRPIYDRLDGDGVPLATP
jgi:hypothetical protein